MVDTTEQGMISRGRKENWLHDMIGWVWRVCVAMYRRSQHNTALSVIVLAFTLMGRYAVG